MITKGEDKISYYLSDEQLSILQFCEPAFDKVPYLQNTIWDALATWRNLADSKRLRDGSSLPSSSPSYFLTPVEAEIVSKNRKDDGELSEPHRIPLNYDESASLNRGIFGASDGPESEPEIFCPTDMMLKSPASREESLERADNGVQLQSAITATCKDEQPKLICGENSQSNMNGKVLRLSINSNTSAPVVHLNLQNISSLINQIQISFSSNSGVHGSVQSPLQYFPAPMNTGILISGSYIGSNVINSHGQAIPSSPELLLNKHILEKPTDKMIIEKPVEEKVQDSAKNKVVNTITLNPAVPLQNPGQGMLAEIIPLRTPDGNTVFLSQQDVDELLRKKASQGSGSVVQNIQINRQFQGNDQNGNGNGNFTSLNINNVGTTSKSLPTNDSVRQPFLYGIAVSDQVHFPASSHAFVGSGNGVEPMTTIKIQDKFSQLINDNSLSREGLETNKDINRPSQKLSRNEVELTGYEDNLVTINRDDIDDNIQPIFDLLNKNNSSSYSDKVKSYADVCSATSNMDEENCSESFKSGSITSYRV